MSGPDVRLRSLRINAEARRRISSSTTGSFMSARTRLPVIRGWTLLAAAALTTGCAPSASITAPDSESGRNARPNLIVILADDLGWGTPNCYGSDPKLVRTPSIDRLAAEGRRFTDACTPASVCTPTRYALLTGRYCWRTRLQREVLEPLEPVLIEPGRLTVATLLRDAGYRTAAVGKWHLGYGDQNPVDFTQDLVPGPREAGFDENFDVPSNHGDLTGVFVENRRVFGLRSANLVPVDHPTYYGAPFLGIDAPQRTDETVMDVLTDRAAAWIDRQEPGKPFFLYFTPVALHTPVTPSPAARGTSGCGPLGDFVHDLDRSVGRILDALDRRGLARDTLVVFTSDNGGVTFTGENQREASVHQTAQEAGLRPNGPWRGRKHSVFEGGFRVPFIARWPGRIPAGTTCEETISLVDLTATTAALLGRPLPTPDQGAEDSVYVLPALLGDGAAPRPLRPDLIEHSADGNFAVRAGDWKWIEGKPHPETRPGARKARAVEFHPRLYNLREDPAEQNDVSAQHSDVVKRLSERLEECRRKGRTRT